MYFLQIISNLQNNLQYIYWKKNLCVNRSMQSKPMLFKGQLYLNFHLKVCSHRWKQSQRDLFTPQGHRKGRVRMWACLVLKPGFSDVLRWLLCTSEAHSHPEDWEAGSIIPFPRLRRVEWFNIVTNGSELQISASTVKSRTISTLVPASPFLWSWDNRAEQPGAAAGWACVSLWVVCYPNEQRHPLLCQSYRNLFSSVDLSFEGSSGWERRGRHALSERPWIPQDQNNLISLHLHSHPPSKGTRAAKFQLPNIYIRSCLHFHFLFLAYELAQSHGHPPTCTRGCVSWLTCLTHRLHVRRDPTPNPLTTDALGPLRWSTFPHKLWVSVHHAVDWIKMHNLEVEN